MCDAGWKAKTHDDIFPSTYLDGGGYDHEVLGEFFEMDRHLPLEYRKPLNKTVDPVAVNPQSSSSSCSLLLSAYSCEVHMSASLKCKPSSKTLLITAKQLFLNRELYRAVQLSV